MNQWSSALPLSWTCTVHICAPSNEFYTPYYYSYPSYATAVALIDYRTFRCILSDYLLLLLAKYPDELEPYRNHENSIREEITSFAMDICASIPFFIGRSHHEHHPEFPKGGAGCMQIIWPLFVCARTRCLSDDLREWCISQLDFIGNACGFRLGNKIAAMAKDAKTKPVDVMTPEFRALWKECLVFASWQVFAVLVMLPSRDVC